MESEKFKISGMRVTSATFLVLVLSILHTTLSIAQSQPKVSAPTDFEVRAVFTEIAPYIDGDLNDEVWQNIPPVTNFTQVWPNDGAAATEDTEVRIAYDRDNLYFAFMMTTPRGLKPET